MKRLTSRYGPRTLLLGLLCLFAAETASSNTHLGVPSEDMVTLKLSGGANSCSFSGHDSMAFFRVKADGSLEAQPFVVPLGRTLIITDMVLRARPGSPTGVQWNGSHSLILELGFDAGSGTEIVAGLPAIPILNEFDGLSKDLGGALHLTGGIAAQEGVELCGVARLINNNFGGGTQMIGGHIHGYFASAQSPIMGSVPAIGPQAMAIMILGMLLSGVAYLEVKRRTA